MIKAGTRIEGPDGMGYTTTHDIGHLSVLTVSTFEPYGGAPVPKRGEMFIGWLVDWLKKVRSE